MTATLAVLLLVALALASDVAAPRLKRLWVGRRAARQQPQAPLLDPGRDRRAEHKARELLRSCVGEEEWAMYRELGLIRVWGRFPRAHDGGEYAYLIYPHKPIVAYEPQTGRLLGEYCVNFPDQTRPFGSVRLPASDDVLAKWMALTGDERRLLVRSNMHLPGRQIDTARVARDLWRLSRWERARMRTQASGPIGEPGVSMDLRGH